MIVRRWYLALALVLLAGCSGVQSGGVNALRPTVAPSDAVVRITYRDGSQELISKGELDQFQNKVFVGPQGQAPAEDVLNELITYRLLLRQARNQDITADPQLVERSVANLGGQFCAQRIQEAGERYNAADPRAALDTCAKVLGFHDDNDFRSFVAEQLTINNVVNQNAEKDLIKAAHILFDAQNGEEADRVYQQLCGSTGSATQPDDQGCNGSGNFTALAKQYSIEPGAKQSGGELPPFNEQGLTEDGTPFDATFVSNTVALKQTFLDGGVAISRPFLTDFGWHIVQIQALQASENAGNAYRIAVLDRARNSQIEDLQDPQTAQGPVPLIGVAEILVDLPKPPEVPTLEPIVPEETAVPEATSPPLEDVTATPEETATPESSAAPEASATATP